MSLKKNGPDFIVADFADEGGRAAEIGQGDDRVGGGPAGTTMQRPPVQFSKHFGLLRVIDQGHDPFLDAKIGQQGVVDTGLDIDQGVAHTKYVKLCHSRCLSA